jgi:S1-C subfamily serine protease
VPMMSRKQLEEIAETVRGVPVLGCLPGSTSAQAGVRYGDIVISVNGVPTPTIDDYMEARKLRADGFDLVLFRDGRTLEVFVPFRSPSDPLETLAQRIADGRYVSPPESSEPSPKTQPS